MSITHSIYAERWDDAAWALIGEPSYLEAWDCLCPPYALEISVRNELITVLNGYLTSPWWGVEHSGLEVIAEPRGLPDDLSPVLGDWAAMVAREEIMAMPTWLLAREILDFDWHTPNILHRGYVMAEMARYFDPDHPEQPFPADVWPGGWYQEVVSPRAFEESMLESPDCREEQLVYTWPRPGTEEVYWCESHYQALGFQDEFFTDLRALGSPEDMDRIRLIIWLDA